MSCPSCVAKCASENTRGNVSSVTGATMAAAVPYVFFRRTATPAHAALNKVIGPSRAAVSGSTIPEKSH